MNQMPKQPIQRQPDPNLQLFEDRAQAIAQQRENYANLAAQLTGDVKAKDRHITALNNHIKDLANQVVELKAKLEEATKPAETTTPVEVQTEAPTQG